MENHGVASGPLLHDDALWYSEWRGQRMHCAPPPTSGHLSDAQVPPSCSDNRPLRLKHPESFLILSLNTLGEQNGRIACIENILT